MKKLPQLVSILLASAVLAACGGGSSSSDKTDNGNQNNSNNGDGGTAPAFTLDDVSREPAVVTDANVQAVSRGVIIGAKYYAADDTDTLFSKPNAKQLETGSS